MYAPKAVRRNAYNNVSCFNLRKSKNRRYEIPCYVTGISKLKGYSQAPKFSVDKDKGNVESQRCGGSATSEAMEGNHNFHLISSGGGTTFEGVVMTLEEQPLVNSVLL